MAQTVQAMLEQSGAFLSGHFRLTSGLHSGNYLQCAKAFELPECAVALSGLLIAEAAARGVVFDVVISPALGGILFGYEVARQAGVRNIFTERDAENRMCLRRGFQVNPGERFLVLEDVVTTGGSTREVIAVVEQGGGLLAGVGCVADRSRGKADFGVPLLSLIQPDFPTHPPEACPLCASGVPVEKPGSRK